MSVFARFAPRLQEAIVARLGWSSLRPVHEEAGAALLDGDNAVVLAPTAGGKTEASMFPTLSRLVDEALELGHGVYRFRVHGMPGVSRLGRWPGRAGTGASEGMASGSAAGPSGE